LLQSRFKILRESLFTYPRLPARLLHRRKLTSSCLSSGSRSGPASSVNILLTLKVYTFISTSFAVQFETYVEGMCTSECGEQWSRLNISLSWSGFFRRRYRFAHIASFGFSSLCYRISTSHDPFFGPHSLVSFIPPFPVPPIVLKLTFCNRDLHAFLHHRLLSCSPATLYCITLPGLSNNPLSAYVHSDVDLFAVTIRPT
jgi:hypothetical protein